jgi:ABC-type uncharacterized transport system substrate-binding protein
MSQSRYLLILVGALCLILIGCTPQAAPPTVTPVPPTDEPTEAVAAAEEPLRVLRLDSYHIEFAWSYEIQQGVLQALADNGYDTETDAVVFDEFFMDTKRNTGDDYFEQIAEETMEYIRETQPDVVIANDNNAARLVAAPMRDEGVNFVLVGYNGDPAALELTDSAYIAGVLERPHMEEMSAWIEQVFGEETRVAMLADGSETSEAMLVEDTGLVDTVNETSLEVVDVSLINDYAEWQEHVKAADEMTDILFLGPYATLRDENDDAVEAADALEWTLENSPVPVMGFWEEGVHLGMLGGSVISGYVQGYDAGVKAAEILGGAEAGDIGFSVPPRGKLMISRSAMERWDIDIPLDLLEVSEIIEP